MDQDLLEAQRLAHNLGLGVLLDPPFTDKRVFCHHLECGCDCRECRQTRRRMDDRGFTPKGNIRGLRAPKQPAQPWERKAA